MRRVHGFLAGESDRRPAAAAAKGSGHWLRLAIIVIVIVVTSAAVLSPLVISWAIHVSQNSTRVEEMVRFFLYIRLRVYYLARRTIVWKVTLFLPRQSLTPLVEIMTKNVSYCPFPLAHTSKGGCFLPCSALDWLQHPTLRTIKPKLSYVLIVINLIAGIAFTFVWTALRKSQ